MDRWTLVSDREPEHQHPVIGYSPHWVDEDFNPDGQRECFVNGEGGWTSAEWHDNQDTYITVDDAEPTHWIKRPASPAA